MGDGVRIPVSYGIERLINPPENSCNVDDVVTPSMARAAGSLSEHSRLPWFCERCSP